MAKINMDITNITNITSIVTGSLGTLLSTYSIFKKSKVEAFFAEFEKNQDVMQKIEENDLLKSYFYKIIEIVASEANAKKLIYWKKVILILPHSTNNLDYTEDFIKILDSLSVTDLTVLHYIYANNFKNLEFKKDVINYFNNIGISQNYIEKNLKSIASHNLISEVQEVSARLGLSYLPIEYHKNDFGIEFIKFCSDI
ncbi:hypothetical protein [Leptospira meyeri]|uniref:hypothetical protein n=1 Tax=Leptospira meyeri TaxID=29508 RepID=UPI0010844931|nr:hypothetical protein [Leptospira meyeri]TGM25415.1 hypothetical protein EHQ73_00785 [Leptospira meyeri]